MPSALSLKALPIFIAKKGGRPTISCLRLEVYFELWFTTSYFLLWILKTESVTGSVQNCPHVGFIRSGMPTKKFRVMTMQVFISNETVLQGSNCQIWFPSIHETQRRTFFWHHKHSQWCDRRQKFIWIVEHMSAQEDLGWKYARAAQARRERFSRRLQSRGCFRPFPPWQSYVPPQQQGPCLRCKR